MVQLAPLSPHAASANMLRNAGWHDGMLVSQCSMFQNLRWITTHDGENIFILKIWQVALFHLCSRNMSKVLFNSQLPGYAWLDSWCIYSTSFHFRSCEGSDKIWGKNGIMQFCGKTKSISFCLQIFFIGTPNWNPILEHCDTMPVCQVRGRVYKYTSR